MSKVKIGFEVDEVDLAKAKAYVARHGGSLNKLVSAFFASLGREDVARLPALESATSILISVSTGKISVMEAARQLELPDAGYVFHLLADKGLPLPRLPEDFVQTQIDDARSALDACLLDTAKTPGNAEKAVAPHGMSRLLIPDSGRLFSLAAANLLTLLAKFSVGITDIVRDGTINRGLAANASVEAQRLLAYYNQNAPTIQTFTTQVGINLAAFRRKYPGY